MIKIENIEVSGWEAAIRGMRNPLNSWKLSDSHWIDGGGEFPDGFHVGENDLDLMKRLAHGGAVHAKYRRMIMVTMDITAPLYWWKEFDTYKVGTVANSCSTMHKIHAKEFTVDDFSHEHLFTSCGRNGDSLEVLESVIAMLNYWRERFIVADRIQEDVEGGFEHKKNMWWQMIQLLPTSYNQRRTVQISYEVAVALHKDRRHHKLDEWHVLCDTLERLPYAEGIIYNIGG